MAYDICVKVKDIGDVYGSYLKSTTNSVYLGNALINKANGVTVSLFKIEKKYIISISRMAIPSFENFTNSQLEQIIKLNVPAYTASAQKVIASRKSNSHDSVDVLKQAEGTKKIAKEKKDQKTWNQFSANKEMFGVEPKFSMDEYADTIDRNAPGYKELKAMSDKIAREILSQSTTDIHRQEERTQANTSAASDDQMYSSVQSASKWDSALEKKKLEKQQNDVPQPSKDSQKTTQETPKEASIDSKKKVSDNELELAKEHENFKNGGWSSVVQFLSEKAKKENALQAENKAAAESVPTSPTSISRDKSPKPQSDSFSKSSPNIASEVSKQARGKDRRSNSGNKRNSEKSPSPESKTSKSVNLISQIKFPSAELCFKHVIQNFKNQPNEKGKSAWGSTDSSVLMSNLLIPHLSPLNESVFSPEKLEEIKLAIAQSKITTPSYKN